MLRRAGRRRASSRRSTERPDLDFRDTVPGSGSKQIPDGFADLLRPELPRRCALVVAVALGRDGARIDRRHLDAPIAHLLEERLGKARHGELRRRVPASTRKRPAPRDRGDVDDVPGALRAQAGENGAGRVEDPRNVRPAHGPPLVDREVENALSDDETRVVDESIHAPKANDELFDRVERSIRVAKVARLELGRSAARANLGGDRLESGAIASQEPNGKTRAAED